MNSNFLRETPIAHRGLHDAQRPENSMPAFLAAAERGYAIETDVRFTKDRQLVLFHDDTLLRLTGDPRAVCDCTYEELKELSLGGKTAHIPLFSDFLREVGGRVPLLIEIKNMPHVKGKEIAAAMYGFLKDYSGEYAVQSFDPRYVRAYKKLCPSVPCGVLGTAEKGVAKGVKAHVIKHMSLNFWVKPDFISYRKEDMLERKVKFKGIRLAWVVRSPEEERSARTVADNIIFENYLPQFN